MSDDGNEDYEESFVGAVSTAEIVARAGVIREAATRVKSDVEAREAREKQDFKDILDRMMGVASAVEEERKKLPCYAGGGIAACEAAEAFKSCRFYRGGSAVRPSEDCPKSVAECEERSAPHKDEPRWATPECDEASENEDAEHDGRAP